jgi:AP endonuclease, family 2
MKIGIITDCMKRNTLAEALADAARLGADGVQIYATTGEFTPDTLGAEAKAKYKALLSQHGLEISALCGDMGGYGFERAEDNALRIEKTKRIIDLAVEFSARVVTTHIGVIPDEKTHPRYAVMLSALTECGSYAAAKGVTLAIETGPEKAKTLKAFIEDTEGGVGVNLDPANFTMVTGQDAVEAVSILKNYIVHTHVKDGRKLDPELKAETVYHAFAVGGVAALNACKGFEELPIGQGDVDWKSYMKALREIGYDGYLTIEREAGDAPFDDIRSAVKFIRSFV